MRGCAWLSVIRSSRCQRAGQPLAGPAVQRGPDGRLGSSSGNPGLATSAPRNAVIPTRAPPGHAHDRLPHTLDSFEEQRSYLFGIGVSVAFLPLRPRMGLHRPSLTPFRNLGRGPPGRGVASQSCTTRRASGRWMSSLRDQGSLGSGPWSPWMMCSVSAPTSTAGRTWTAAVLMSVSSMRLARNGTLRCTAAVSRASPGFVPRDSAMTMPSWCSASQAHRRPPYCGKRSDASGSWQPSICPKRVTLRAPWTSRAQ